ncbi:hypothetical protein [Bosea sp. (in: a-proteobacteria)]|uniref:hypothetical protein n=1 Tax=Bosea sp. (in: a-proteobacteria) TaxID=1871050 RepID=UPI000AF60483|nr:hypothetical protein [Bosea sp. (in: a-proteobacteria)]
MIGIDAALRKALVANQRPVVTEYALFLILRQLISDKVVDGVPIRQVKSSSVANRDTLRSRIRSLLKGRYARPDEDFYPGVNDGEPRDPSSGGQHYKVLRIADVPDASAEEISALVDPFCYLSHLSAMQRYGLTNRSPAGLVISTPEVKLWREQRDAKIAKDYAHVQIDERFELGAPTRMPLEKIDLPETLRGRALDRHTTKHRTELRPIRGSFARIPAIGEVFVQMIDRPELCGGINHVLEVWAGEAKTYLDEIIKAVDGHDQSIIKVRAGYLLETLAEARDPRIDAWQKFAQRGGSRKLDSGAPYLAIFSEKWMLSLNVESEFLPTAG